MSHLSSIAAGLTAGATNGTSFGQLTVSGYSYAALTESGTGGSMGFSYKAVHDWDPKYGTRAFFMGAGHPSSPGGAPTKAWCYQISTNTITPITVSAAANTGNNGHTYGQIAINPATKTIFYRAFGATSAETFYWRLNIDKNPGSIGGGDWVVGPDIPTGVATRPVFEYFPESNDLCIFYDRTLYTRNEETGSTWQTILTSANFTQTSSGVSGILLYNPIYKCLILTYPNATDTGEHAYRIDFNVTTRAYTATALTDSTYHFVIASSSLPFIDPISGKLVIISRNPTDPSATFTDYRRDVLTVTGSGSWTTDLNFTVPAIGSVSAGGGLFDSTVVSLYDQGVALFFGEQNIFIYKHTANTVAADGLSWNQVKSFPGVLGYYALENQSELRYVWAQGIPALDAAMSGETYWSSPTHNTTAGIQPTGIISKPVIDTSNPPTGMAGSLKSVVPKEGAEAGHGSFQTNFDGSYGNATKYIAPGSTIGRIIYKRFMLKVNSALLTQSYRENDSGGSQGTYFATIPAGAGTTITLDNNVLETPISVYVGRKIAISYNGSLTNWVPGIYNITAMPAANQITLSTRPCNSNAGSGALVYVGGSGSLTSWKTDINFGNAPNGGSSSGVEVTGVNGNGFPQMYGQAGTDPYPTNSTVPYVANTWHEVLERIEVRGTANAQTSLVQAYLDGQLFLNYGQARINWGQSEGEGLWQALHTNYMTRQDPTQTQVADGIMWQGGFIFSTQPIPGVTATATPPVGPPSAPSLLIALAPTYNQVNLTWMDNASDEDGFQLERCTGAGCSSFATIAMLGPNVVSYQDSGKQPLTTYQYRILAFNAGGGNSAYSATASVTTPAAPPGGGSGGGSPTVIFFKFRR